MIHLHLKDVWFSKEEKIRRRKVKELIKIYSNDWADLLEKEIQSLFKDQEEAANLCSRADTSLNLLKWTTDTLASVYSKRVTRVIETDQGEIEDPTINDAQYDMALDAADKMMFLCREVFVRPVWLDDTLILDLATPDRVAVILNPKNHRVMDAIAIQTSEGGGFQVWTNEEFLLLDKDWNILPEGDQPNQYGFIPWLACHANYPIHSFFNESQSEGLKRATIQAGVAKTDYNHLRHIQSFKQVVITGASKEEQKTLRVGPSAAFHLQDPQGSVNVLDLQANLKDHLDSLLSSVAATLNLYGIRPEQVRGNLTASSGYALEIQMHETEKVWQHHRQMWRLYEQELFEMAREIQASESFTFLQGGQLVIDFPNIGPSGNPQDEIDYISKAVASGLMSKVEAMQRLFGYNEERALLELEKIKKEQNMLNPMGFDVPLSSVGFDNGE